MGLPPSLLPFFPNELSNIRKFQSDKDEDFSTVLKNPPTLEFLSFPRVISSPVPREPAVRSTFTLGQIPRVSMCECVFGEGGGGISCLGSLARALPPAHPPTGRPQGLTDLLPVLGFLTTQTVPKGNDDLEKQWASLPYPSQVESWQEVMVVL